MKAFLRNVGAVVVGIVLGGVVNMAIVYAGAALMPPPPGVDVSDPASIDVHLREYSVPQLLAPFVAHAVGTLVGAAAAARLAATRPLAAALAVGGVFMLGGIAAVRMMPSTPAWFAALDLGAAYLPMGWLGARLAAPRR
jgi:hypothetical protein